MALPRSHKLGFFCGQSVGHTMSSGECGSDFWFWAVPLIFPVLADMTDPEKTYYHSFLP
jgi:hypothetical protein